MASWEAAEHTPVPPAVVEVEHPRSVVVREMEKPSMWWCVRWNSRDVDDEGCGADAEAMPLIQAHC
jgi:hypothetical protein